jgi:putative transposase
MTDKPPKKRANQNEIPDVVLDQLLENYEKPDDLFGHGGIFDRLKERLVQRILEGELTAHLGFGKGELRPEGQDNTRNGYCPPKTVKTDNGQMQVSLPRDRDGSFEPVMVPKNARRLPGFDDAVIHLYSKGMTVRDIQDHLREIYKTEVSPDLISEVTDEVLKEVTEWQNRPLDDIYPIVYLDALVIRVRDGGRVAKKAVYLALGVNMDGNKELLGLWIGENEGAKFWLGVLTELRNRGLKDILIACVDGLTGFPEAIEVVYPKTKVQLCIVHMVRNSLALVNSRQRQEVAVDLRMIYQAATETLASDALEEFCGKWDARYPLIGKSWRTHWENLRTFFEYPPDIRKVIYTTNAIESLNHSLRKVIKNRKSFPNDDAVKKALYLGLRNAAKKWTRPVPNWPSALNRFAIEFGDRMPGS